jgi:transcriptional regulator
MYLPKHFEETRVPVLHDLIRAYPLGALVTLGPEGLDANHIPFEVDPVPGPLGALRGHVARANPVWRETAPDRDCLVIFRGPEGYISPAWYPTKQETARVVPTWNYAVVHAYGRLRAVEDRDWLRAFVERLTRRHEAGRPEPWQVGDAPAAFIESMLAAIVGIEIPLARLVGKWKVSQNRPPQDRDGVIAGLAREHGPAGGPMADLVRAASGRTQEGAAG